MDKLTAFKALLFEANTAAKHAHGCCFGDKEDRVLALTYAAACTAKSSAAEAIYWCSPELENDDIPALLHRFDAFTNEIREDYRTDHSRQWVDIEYNQLQEHYANVDYALKRL